MARNTAILSVKIISDGKAAQIGLARTSKGVQVLERTARRAGPAVTGLARTLGGVGSARALAGVSRASSGIAGLGRASLRTIAPVLALARAGTRLGRSLLGVSRSALRATLTVLRLGTVAAATTFGISLLGAGALTVAAQLAVLAVALTPLAGLLVGLPALFLAPAAAAAVFTVAIKDAGKVLGDLKPKVEALRASISGAFWDQAARPVRRLATGALPLLERALTRTASLLGTQLAAAADVLRSALGNQVTTVLDNLNAGLAAAGHATRPLVRGLLDLLAVSSSLLPRVGALVGDVAARFGRFLTASAGDGRLSAWLNDGIALLRTLGSIAVNVLGVFRGLGRAMTSATGSGQLGAIADGMRDLNRAVNGNRVQAALTNLFTAAGRAVRSIAPGVRVLGNALAGLVGTLGNVMVTAARVGSALLAGIGGALSSPALRGGLNTALTQIGSAASAITPAIAALGPVVGALAQQLGPILSTAIRVASGLVQQLAPTIVGAVNTLGPAVERLVTVFGGLAPVLAPAADAASRIGAALLDGIGGALSSPALQSGAQTLFAQIGSAASAITPAIAALGPVVGALAQQLGPILGTALRGVSTLVQGLAPLFTRLVTTIGPVINQVLGGLTAQLPGALKALGPIVGTLGRALGNLAPVIGPAVTAVARLAASLLGGLGTALASPALKSGLMTLFKELGTAARSVGPAIAALGPVVGALAQQIGPILGTAVRGVAGIIRALAPTVTSLLGSLGPAIHAIVQVLASVLPPIVKSLGPILTTLGRGIGQVVQGLAPALKGVGDAVKGLLDQLAPVVKVLVPVLVPVLKFLGNLLLGSVKGAIEGITQVIKGVVDVVVGVVRFFRALFTGDWKGAWEALKQIATGLMNVLVGGIKTWLYGSVVGIFRGGLLRLTGLWKGGWGAIKALPRVAFTFIKNAAVKWFAGQRVLFTKGMQVLREVFARNMRRIASTPQAMWATVRTVFARGIAWLRTAVSSGLLRVVRFFIGLPGRIARALLGLHARFRSFGVNLIKGFIAGIGSMTGKLVDKVKGAFGSAVRAGKKVLGIASPSRIAKGMGLNFGQTWINALGSLIPKSNAAMSRLLSPPAAAAPPSVVLDAPPPPPRDDRRPRPAMTVNVRVDGFVGSSAELAQKIAEILGGRDYRIGTA